MRQHTASACPCFFPPPKEAHLIRLLLLPSEEAEKCAAAAGERIQELEDAMGAEANAHAESLKASQAALEVEAPGSPLSFPLHLVPRGHSSSGEGGWQVQSLTKVRPCQTATG